MTTVLPKYLLLLCLTTRTLNISTGQWTTNSISSPVADLKTVSIHGKVTCHYVPMKCALVQLYKTALAFDDLIDETVTESDGIFHLSGSRKESVEAERFYIVVRHHCGIPKKDKSCVHWDQFLLPEKVEEQEGVEVSEGSWNRVTDCNLPPPKTPKKIRQCHITEKLEDFTLLRAFLENKFSEQIIRAALLNNLSKNP